MRLLCGMFAAAACVLDQAPVRPPICAPSCPPLQPTRQSCIEGNLTAAEAETCEAAAALRASLTHTDARVAAPTAPPPQSYHRLLGQEPMVTAHRFPAAPFCEADQFSILVSILVLRAHALMAPAQGAAGPIHLPGARFLGFCWQRCRLATLLRRHSNVQLGLQHVTLRHLQVLLVRLAPCA